MVDISSQASGGFLQTVNQRSYLRPTQMRHQQSRNGQCDFFKLLELAPQPLAVFISFCRDL
jgi:hypothetical protein